MKLILLFISILPFSLFAQYFSVHQLIEAQKQPLEYLDSIAVDLNWMEYSRNRGTETTLDNITYTYGGNSDLNTSPGVLTCYFSNKTLRLLYKFHDKRVYNAFMREISYMGFIKNEKVAAGNYLKQYFTSPGFIIISEKREGTKTVAPVYFLTILKSEDYFTLLNRSSATLVSNK